MSWNPFSIVRGVRSGVDQLDVLYKEFLRMDEDTTLPLKRTLGSIQAIIEHHHRTGGLENNEGLIDQTIAALDEIISSEAPETIFSNPDKKDEQRRFAQGIQEQCRPLLSLLRDFNAPGLAKPSMQAIAEQLQKVHGVLTDEQRKQVGPLARGMNYLSQRVQDEYQRVIGQQKQVSAVRRTIANEHPLTRLLGLLGVYEHGVHLPDRREIALYDALFELDGYEPHFKGVLNSVLEEERLPASNDVIFIKISNFLRRAIYHDHVLNEKEMNEALLNVHAKAFAIGNIVPQEIRGSGDDRKITWAKDYIKGAALPEDAELRGLVERARTESKFRHIALFIFLHRQVQLAHSELQLNALKVHIFDLAFPDQQAEEEARKIERVQPIISGEHVLSHEVPQALKLAVQQGRLNQLQTEEAQIDFGKCVIINAADEHWPHHAGDRGLAEAMWMAVAHYGECQKCEGLFSQLKPATNGQVTDLAPQFDILISLLEKKPQLLPSDNEALFQRLPGIILGWINLAMREMKNIRGADEGEIDRKFDRVTELIAKGQYLDAMLLAQRHVEESPLGLRMWAEEETASPKIALETLLEDFCAALPPRKPPKSSEEVRRRLGLDEIPPNRWDQAWKAVIQKEKDALVSNTCDFSAFNISMQYVLGKTKEKSEEIYKKLVEALDEVAGANGLYNYSEENVRQAIAKVTNRFEHEIPEESVRKILIALDEVRHANYSEERMKRELHETLYFSLLWEVMESDQELSFFTKFAGHGLLVIIHKLLEFFITPFSEALLKAIQEDVILPANGSLTETHLAPVNAFACALDSYNAGKKAWATLKKEQIAGSISPDPDRMLAGKTELEAMDTILDDPLYYHGYDPRELDCETGYLAVDHFLQVVDFCSCLKLWHEDITRNANSPLIEDPEGRFQEWVNYIGILIKRIFSIIPHAAVYAIHFCLKVFEMLFNFLAKQLAKFAIWKWDIVTNLIDEMTESLFHKTHHTPVIDELVLDQLKELKTQILEESQEERSGLSEHESPAVKKQIREAFAQLLESIDLDSKDTSQEVEDQKANPTVQWVKDQLKSSLKDLATTLFIVSSESFLSRDQINEVVLKGLTSANEHLRGKEALLNHEELAALERRLNGRAPTQTEIERYARDIHGKLQENIRRQLNDILEKGVNPVISRTIDQGLKGPSDMLLAYGAWMERRLFSYPGQGLASERNIIHMLRRDFQDFANKTPQEQRASLRQIHEDYTTFLREFIAKQTNIDKEQIPNDLKLNRLFRTEFEPILRYLNDLLTEFMRNEKMRADQEIVEEEALQLEALQLVGIEETLKRFENKLIEKRETFNKIKRAEQSRVEGMHQGIRGFGQTFLDTAKGVVHDEVTPIAQRLLNEQIRQFADKSTGLYQNPVLVRHIIRHQMLGWIEARA